MFYYKDTKKLSQPKEKQNRVVLKTRKVTYYNDSPNIKVTEPVVSYGFETVEEGPVSLTYTGNPVVVDVKVVDNRNPNRYKEFLEQQKEEESNLK